MGVVPCRPDRKMISPIAWGNDAKDEECSLCELWDNRLSEIEERHEEKRN
jgi:hypothetical protein